MASESRTTRNALVAVLIVAAIAAGAYLGLRKNEAEPFVAVPERAEPPPPPPIEPAQAGPKYPIPEAIGTAETPVEPLPALDQSDAAILALLASLFGQSAVEMYANPEFVIQRIVTTVDNLPKRKIAPVGNPVRPVGGSLVTEGADDAVTLGAANAARYAPYVELVDQLDVDALAAGYRRLYPLFQQAYRELGDPDAYFNDRVVEVVDHLLAAPDAEPPVRLTKDKAFWAYVDPSLEARSAGEKLMVRLGPEQAARVKRKLAALRIALTEVPEPVPSTEATPTTTDEPGSGTPQD